MAWSEELDRLRVVVTCDEKEVECWAKKKDAHAD